LILVHTWHIEASLSSYYLICHVSAEIGIFSVCSFFATNTKVIKKLKVEGGNPASPSQTLPRVRALGDSKQQQQRSN
jgi:hypothetical protein